MHFPLFGELIIILGLATGILLLFRKFKLPGILGFIVTGMIAGPHGLGWVKEVEEVEAMAEIGVVLLLFVIGMEFSLKKLAALGRTVFIGGTLQAGLTTLLVTGVLALFGMRTESAVFVGFLVTLSSTAIVLRILQEKGKMDVTHGRVATAILIFQDIIVVPMMLVTPLLAGKSTNISMDLMWMLAKMILLLVAVFISGRYIVPRLLAAATKGKGNDLFIISIVVICFAAAFATQALGLSLALGAFFAGLVISETDHAYHATGIVLPFHELFMSFFFVSIGMLVDLHQFAATPFLIIGLTVALIVLKVLTTTLAVWFLKYPLRTALHTGLTLFQLGEFGFILAIPGLELGLLSKTHYQVFLSVSILSMGATPFILEYSDRIVRYFFLSFVPSSVSKRLDRLMRVKKEQERTLGKVLKDHVVVIGFGLNGRNVANAAIDSGIRCAVIESELEVAQRAQAIGLPTLVGDATNSHLLEQAHVERARVVVVAINDQTQTLQIIAAVRSISNTAHIIVRTRYVRDLEDTYAAGANEVIPEEFETSIEIFHRVLRKYLVPEVRIQDLIASIRNDHYERLRGKSGNKLRKKNEPLAIPGLEIATLPVTLGRSKVVGRSIAESQLREQYGITVLAIRREGRYITNVKGDARILTDDLLYLLGSPENIVRLDHDLR
ncbi:MAG: cation:proton antiporter [Flavobacteriales bacterium]|jgi:CPA2 family monovalent cation:H+ antiporter-2|nr:cation:proton antiporter [Flavobacteriales bacterium]MBK6882362.1 cation:proton antiporter [Flavobacteriales bacterium]MBK7101420.1 cation:proton antiporter [Flavobacteriales bacterium]MBK7112128.1 cation:proton antiporter [Flavobacteriales bacterium]MBK7481866.1 cation:proton antiporter [Flavobacteriales bacterium]